MTERFIIRNTADLVNLLPKVTQYRPAEGSILAIDSAAQPVAVLYPELLATFDENDVDDEMRLATDLRVFRNRAVVLLRVGHFAPLAFVSRALNLVDANILTHISCTEDEILTSYSGTDKNFTRDEFLHFGGQQDLDKGYERGVREAAKRWKN